jgi:hypothetical protein
LSGAVVQQGLVSFPDIPAGESAIADEPCEVTIDADAEDGLQARFRLVANAGTEQSDGAFELTVAAPRLQYNSHSVGGGTLDPGATATLDVTLLNDGSTDASLTQLTLRAVTPTLATVSDSASTIGPISVGRTATTGTAFTIVADDEAAVGQAAAFTLHMTTAEGYESTTSFSVIIGSVDYSAPLGPDAYGYYAYDCTDLDYPDAVPAYEWINTSVTYGGAGTRLDLTDNTTVTVPLPFAFTYYGETYNHLLICDNGWASFDTTAYYDFYNWSMPNTYGNGAQLAAFWDNLDPTKEFGGELVGDGIYVLDDSENDRFVVEWSRIGNLRTQHDNHEDWDELQTFQIVLYDPAAYPTPTGDGRVRFQYRHVVNNDNERMFSTIGIESPDETTGIEYTYDNSFPAAAAPLSAGLAIEFSTIPPRYSPFRLARVNITDVGDGVQLAWEPIDERPRGGYRIYRADASGEFAPVAGGRLGPDARSFLDETADPDADHRYEIGVVDPIGREARFGPFTYGVAALKFSLARIGPNPFHSSTLLGYSIPALGPARLTVYDVTGRLVRTLVEGDIPAGHFTANWDGRDQSGHVLPSGIYFGRLEAGAEQRSVKLTLIR